MKEEDTEEGGSPTTQRGKAEAIQKKTTPREEHRGQYNEQRQRLYKTRARKRRIADNTLGKARL